MSEQESEETNRHLEELEPDEKRILEIHNIESNLDETLSSINNESASNTGNSGSKFKRNFHRMITLNKISCILTHL